MSEEAASGVNSVCDDHSRGRVAIPPHDYPDMLTIHVAYVVSVSCRVGIARVVIYQDVFDFRFRKPRAVPFAGARGWCIGASSPINSNARPPAASCSSAAFVRRRSVTHPRMIFQITTVLGSSRENSPRELRRPLFDRNHLDSPISPIHNGRRPRTATFAYTDGP